MRTRLFGVVALGLFTAACGQANLYPMPADQAYTKLVEAKITPSGKGPFGKLHVVASGDGTSTVKWVVSEAGVKLCEANIAPEGDKSRITAFCDGGGEGAATGIMQNMHRNAIIEHIDATLRGRDYDFRLAQGSTASGWPKDPRQADSSMAGAATAALKMERDMKRDIKEMEQAQEQDRADAAQRLDEYRSQQPVNYDPSKPVSQPSN